MVSHGAVLAVVDDSAEGCESAHHGAVVMSHATADLPSSRVAVTQSGCEGSQPARTECRQ